MMKTRFWIPAVLAAIFSTGAFAHGGDRDDRGWDDHRGRDHWQQQRHEDWRYDHRRDNWRHDHRRPPYAYGYAPPQRRYEEPVVLLPVPPLPPPPHEVLRDLLRGHR